jgi:hypothetical protein
MPLFGYLGILEAGVRRFEGSAAVLLVRIEEKGIEPPVEIVMMRDVVFRTGTQIELPGMPNKRAHPPLQLGPAGYNFRLRHQDRQHVRERAAFDDESPLRVGFTQRKFRVEQDAPFGVSGQESNRYGFAGSVAAAKC